MLWRSSNAIAYSIVVAPLVAVGGLQAIASPIDYDAARSSVLFLSPHCLSVGALGGPVISILILFTGPLLEGVLRFVLSAQTELPPSIAFSRCFSCAWMSDPTAVRSRIVAPLTEEWVFRCCTLILFHATGAKPTACILGAAVSFGGAHVHHYFERRREGWSEWDAACHVALQFCYTGLFGSIVRGVPALGVLHRSQRPRAAIFQASYYLWYSGSFWGIVLVHSFCNTMGLPVVSWWWNRRDPLHAWRLPLAAALCLGAVVCVATTPALLAALSGPCAL